MFYPSHGEYFDGRGPGALAIIMMVVLWVAVILLVIGLVQKYRHAPRHPLGAAPLMTHTVAPVPASSPAIDLLKERFAKGEVSEEEFLRRLTLLKQS